MAEDLSQAEIDRLLETINREPNEIAVVSIEEAERRAKYLRNLYKQLRSAEKRYYAAMENGASHDVVMEHRRAFHHYAFKNWLERRGMDRGQYYALMREEMKKRGMR